MRRPLLAGNALVLGGAILLMGPALHFGARVRAQTTAISGARASRPSVPAGGAWGRIEIPRVGLDFVVFEGVSDATLRKGPGHVPGTASPGVRDQAGNCVIAGHRDSFFHRLSTAREGDLVRVHRAEGVSSYRLGSRRIVRPEDVSVLLPTRDRRLTLITCYPFGWIGAAPYRLVWDAVAIGSSSAASSDRRDPGTPEQSVSYR